MTLGVDPLLFSELMLGFQTRCSDLSASLSTVTLVLIWVLSRMTNCPPGCLELGHGVGVFPGCGTLSFKLSRKESDAHLSAHRDGMGGGAPVPLGHCLRVPPRDLHASASMASHGGTGRADFCS